MRIGSWTFPNPVFLAPMAGITDKPFRLLARSLGAGHAISEMVASKPSLRHSVKSRARTDHTGENSPVHVQIAGADAAEMADAARHNVDLGADIIDINMGCPAKKVCHRLAGSSLLRDEKLVASILERVVAAVDVPVTLKTRTGWDARSRNVTLIGRIAQSAGIAAIALHGRTRNDFYDGEAEYDSLKRLRDAVDLPLVANGDISCPIRARHIIAETGADAVMIGRAARARPWFPGAVAAFLATGNLAVEPAREEKHAILRALVVAIHRFYGEERGVRMARKHIAWQLAGLNAKDDMRREVLKAREPSRQLALLDAIRLRPANRSQAA